MSADNQDMANRLMIQLAQSGSPSFDGIQAPANPAGLLAALSQIQQQQQITPPAPGQYGYLHDASTRGFQQLGQQMGNFSQSGNTATPIVPSQVPNPFQGMNGAMQQAKQLYATELAKGTPPDQANIKALTSLAQAGVPGAAEHLSAAQTTLLGNQDKVASAAKNTAQGNAATDEIANRAKVDDLNQKKDTYTTTYVDPQGYYELQKNGLGETKRVELKPALSSLVSANPDDQAAIARAIYEGRQAPITGAALKTPAGLAIMAQVNRFTDQGPYDATNYAGKAKAFNDFTTGKSGQAVKSFNVALSHLDTLGNAANALQNGDVKSLNALGNTIAQQTGGTAPTDFNSIKGIVGDEITKAILGSGGGVADREEAKATIDAANSPAQLQSAIGKYRSLMAGQLAGLRTQYESSTGRKDFETKLEPRSIAIAHASPEYTSVFPNQAAPSAAPSTGWGAAAVVK